jgi:hypothetical protein
MRMLARTAGGTGDRALWTSAGAATAAAVPQSRTGTAWAWAQILLPLVALAAMFGLTGLKQTTYDNYVYLADAWRHGRLWIEFPGDFLDAVPFHGRAYVIQGPTPALLLFPFVWFFGQDTNQTILSAALGAIAVFAALRLCRNLGVAPGPAIVLTAFLFFGTSMFVCAALGAVWGLAHVSAAAFTLLALAELYGRRRPWIVAVWALAAAFSRLPLLAAVPVYFVLLSLEPERRRELIWFAAICLGVAPLAVWYNEARWGTFVDMGFTIFYRIMDITQPRTGVPFSLANIPRQFQAFFWSDPPFAGRFPWLKFGDFGTSLAWTSPALVLAAGARTARSVPLWVLLAVSAAPAFLYFEPGGLQFGMRHALDFEPFLFALIAMSAAQRPIPRWGLALLGYSIAIGFAGAFVWYASAWGGL